MTSYISVKAFLVGEGPNFSEIHRFSLDVEPGKAGNFNLLKEKVTALFPQLRQGAAKFKINYKDEENDLITLSSDEELSLALSSITEDNLFKIYIECNPMSKCGRRCASDDPSSVHPGVTCDGCERAVAGFRYKCLVCPDYDLCSCCETKKMHSQHTMIRLPTPSAMPHWNGMMGGGSQRCSFNQRQFQHCFEKFKAAAKKCYEQQQSGATAGANADGQNNPQMPFQKIFENMTNHFNSFVRQTSKDGENAKTKDENVPPFPQPHEVLVNLGDVISNVLNNLGVKVDVEAEDLWGQRQHCGDKKDDSTDVKSGPNEEEKKPNETETESDREPLLASADKSSSDGETTEGWTYVNEKAKDNSAGAIPKDPTKLPFQSTLDQMLAMGFSNEGGWLSQLLEIKNGNIDAVLELLAPMNNVRK